MKGPKEGAAGGFKGKGTDKTPRKSPTKKLRNLQLTPMIKGGQTRNVDKTGGHVH